MIKARFAPLSTPHATHAPHLLAIVRQRGKIESVTIFRTWRNEPNATRPIESFCGALDIEYSYSSTYKMLDRPKSGLRTGIPLKGETFEILSFAEARAKAQEIYKQDFPQRKKWQWFFPPRNKKGQFTKKPLAI